MNEANSCRRKEWKNRASRSKSSHRSMDMNNTLDFPFLQDEETKRHLQHSKIMIILRGLPGSGKSFLAKKIKQKYGKDSYICSADKFFERQGEYNFDPSKLEEAHRVCKDKAKQQCCNGKHVIVVDNCNIQEWEMEYYLNLALENGYIQLVIETKSFWKFTVEILAAKNSHGLKQNVLRRKLSQWEHLHPVYYAWFVNERDSVSLKNCAISYINECLRIKEFSRNLGGYMQNPQKDFCQYFNLNYQQLCGLHCTAVYFGKKNKNEARGYAEKPEVVSEYGKVSKLYIVGFIISPQSFGACINLTTRQLQIWKQHATQTERGQLSSVPYNHVQKPPRRRDLSWESELAQSLSSVVINSETKQTMLCPTHITLGNKPGSKPQQTGIDLTSALNLELKSQVNGKSVPIFELSGGWAKKYGNYWLISLEKAHTINALFASFI